ncbi:MAG TPA: ABC transporter substrate-binding protein, partial [Spirochaetales bacterium]|nr:ABC transporter substrate-binding protein [Spirochaetales bacterium]HRY53237.1 ABC transporter substrate-binding protein [Spirochaetia bacterium]
MRKFAALLALLLLLAALPGAAFAQKTVKFGVFEPLTGANAAGGAEELDGIRLAQSLYPTVKAGGVEYKIELAIADNKSDKVEAANAGQNLVDREKVQVVLGSWGSGLSMAAGPIFRDAKVPAIGLSCTNPLVTKDNDYYFRVCFLDPFQGTVMSTYAFNNLKAKKAVLIREVSNDYSVGLAKFFA